MKEERFVGIREVAEMLSVSERSVSRWVSSLGLPAYKIGGTLRFRMSEVKAWLEEMHTTHADSEDE